MSENPVTTQTPNQISFDDATEDQLRMFSDQYLGITFHHATGIGKIRAGIRQAWKPDYIVLFSAVEDGPVDVQVERKPISDDETKPVEVQGKIRALGAGTSKNDPKVRLIINETPGPGGKRAIFVSCNGVAMLIPRGEEVDVPYRYYLILKAAVMTAYEQDDETFDIIGREVASYPFQVVRLPTHEEMQPWHDQEWASQFGEGIEVPDRHAAA